MPSRPAPADRSGNLARGDAVAKTVFQYYEKKLFRALAQVINLLNPDAIVLGGGWSNGERL